MKTLLIKSFTPGNTFQNPHFFILCKGLNSGKPLLTPCPNCFVIQCCSAEEKEQLYWLVYSLWQSKAFYPFHKGSVIPFITIKDTCECIATAQRLAALNLDRFYKAVASLQQLESMAEQFKKNLILINQAKRMLFYNFLIPK